MLDIVEKAINDSIKVKTKLLSESTVLNILNIADVLTNSFRSGKKVLFCGNGGSAADAQHLAAEFSGRFYKDRKALPSEALHCNTSYLTAVANDYSFDDIYSRIIDGIGIEGDVLIGITTSGNSKNIINAFKKANELGVLTIGLTGKGGGLLKQFSNFIVEIDSSDTPRIQESHILVGHIICEIVESKLF